VDLRIGTHPRGQPVPAFDQSPVSVTHVTPLSFPRVFALPGASRRVRRGVSGIQVDE
jgi:hypothetical protein